MQLLIKLILKLFEETLRVYSVLIDVKHYKGFRKFIIQSYIKCINDLIKKKKNRIKIVRTNR